MKSFIYILFISLLSLNTLYAQDITFTFANAEITNDGTDDYYEADIMIASTVDFYAGSGQLYIEYNTDAFGESIANTTTFEYGRPAGSILGQTFFGGFVAGYKDFVENNNTASRVSVSFQQNATLEIFTTQGGILTTATPKVLMHIKIKYADINELPEVCFFYDNDLFQDQFITATGVQLVNDTYDCSAASIGGGVLSTGGLIISELMQNPAAVADASGEYFEIYNPEASAVNLNGWTISDSSGDLHTITSDIIVDADGFIVLGNNSDLGTNGGVTVDYQYTNIDLSNGADAIVLTDGLATEIDRVVYDGGTLWPNPDGAAMLYIGSDIEDNNDGTLWKVATVSEGITTDFGSPRLNGTDQIINWLVYSSNAWNREPSADTGGKNALIRASEVITFTTDISLLSLVIKEDADVNIDTAANLTAPNIILESTSIAYSSLISDGTITGLINYRCHVNQNASIGGNDLISPPVSGQAFNEFAGSNSNLVSNTDNSLFLFGPFDKASGSYLTYASSETIVLSAGTGYRAATTDNGTLHFQGTINQGAVTQDVTNSGPFYAEWNLIGNPYPSYLNVQDFLNNTNNLAVLDAVNVGIYGYDGDASDGWVIYNLNTTDANTNITPGQGFFVAIDNDGVIDFTPNMRRHGNTDDFITGRNNNSNHHIELQLNSNSKNYKTDFYFNNNSSNGLDAGYDAAVFGYPAGSFSMYSHLVEDNNGIDMAIQSLPLDFLYDGVVPLGINANQGEQLTIAINTSVIPDNVEVYLEDVAANTFTLLNSTNYVFTSSTVLLGTGRFFIHFSDNSLSSPEIGLNKLKIYTDNKDNQIVIKGQLHGLTKADLYDLNGRKIISVNLDTSIHYNTINTALVESGIYIVHLFDGQNIYNQKVIVN